MAQAHSNTLLNAIGVLAFVILGGILTKELMILDLGGLVLAVTALCGYILADFLSGFVHFMGDTFGSPRTPIIGKAFIFPFREHHADQTAITRHTFFVTNGNNCIISLPAMVLMHLVLFPLTPTNTWFALLFSTSFFLVLSVFATNQIHKWAHMKKPPRIVRLLQSLRLILNPKHHAMHHAAPHTSYFCITTGWLNPMLEKLDFFKRIRNMCGIKK